MSRHREGTVYLVVRPGRYYGTLTVDKATNKRPKVTSEGSIVVKLNLSIPEAAFLPLSPEATVTVPEGMVRHPVTVEATDAND